MQIKNTKIGEGNVKIIDNRDRKKFKLFSTKAITIFLIIILLSLSYFYIDPSVTGFSEIDLNSLFSGNESNETVIVNLTNTTEIGPQYSIQPVNISNITIGNATEVINLTNVTAPIALLIENATSNTTEAVQVLTKDIGIGFRNKIEWNNSFVDQETFTGKRLADSLYFDGKKDFDLIKGSESIVLANKTFTIYARIKIEASSQGSVVSRYDYPNVSRIVLGVDSSGSVKLDLGDVGFSTILETSKTYNDDQYHEITAVVNNTIAQLYVDSLLEVESNISEMREINTQVPISIGANTGFGVFDNYLGEIQEVRIYY